MATKTLTALTLAAAVGGAAAALGTTGTVSAQDMVKCYGIALAGQNDCANAAGTHSCAGQSTVDFDGGEWKLVPAGSCNEPGSEEPFAGVGGTIPGLEGSDPNA